MSYRSELSDEIIREFNAGRISECSSSIIKLAASYNFDIKKGKNYNHNLKHRLFFTDFIKSPLRGGYDETIYQNTFSAVEHAYKALSALNEVEHKDENSDALIDDRILKDLYEILLYLTFIADINEDNQKKLDKNLFSKKQPIEQLILVSLHFRKQVQDVENRYSELLKANRVGELFLSVEPDSIDVNKTINGAPLDVIELELEAINQMVRYLYYVNRKSFPERVSVSLKDVKKYGSIDDTSLLEFIKIDSQYSLLSSFEESERYGYFCFQGFRDSENGTRGYIFDLEDEKIGLARYYGIFRRQYLLALHSKLNDEFAYLRVQNIMPALMDQLISIQKNNNPLFQIEDFRPTKSQIEIISAVAFKKKELIDVITKPIYHNIRVGGIQIADFLNACKYIYSLAWIVDKVSQEINNGQISWKNLSVINLDYFQSELSRLYGYDSELSKKLIDCLVFHEKNNRGEDIFSNPLIKVSQTQVLFSPDLVSQINVDRAIEKIVSKSDKSEKAEAGTEFEKYFISSLNSGYKESVFGDQRIPIPDFQINTNKIKYDAFDEKEIEFDVVIKLCDYIILTELKSVMTPYTYCDLDKRKNVINEAIEQLKRRKESIQNEKDWKEFKSRASIQLPDLPYDDDHIILVACTDAYDFTPTKHGEIFITDDSTFIQYFANPYIENIELVGNRIASTENKSLWKSGKPTPNEFKAYLENPCSIDLISSVISKQYKPLPIFEKKKYCVLVADYGLKNSSINK